MSDRVNNFRRERFLRFVDPSYGLPDPDDLPRSDASFTEAYNAVGSLDTSDVVEEVVDDRMQRLEKEVVGAWRAGYDYVHVYERRATKALGGAVEVGEWYTFETYVLPSHSEEPLDIPDVRHSMTYDLTSVPDHVMRAAWRGELDEYERIERDPDEVDFV